MPHQKMTVLFDLLEPAGEIGKVRVLQVRGGDDVLHLGAQHGEFDRRTRQMTLEAAHVLHRQIADLAKVRVAPMRLDVEGLLLDAACRARLTEDGFWRTQHRFLARRMRRAAKARERCFIVDRLAGVRGNVLLVMRRVHPAGRQAGDRFDPAHELLVEFALTRQHQFQIACGERHHPRETRCRADLLGQHHQICPPDREQGLVGIFHCWVFHLFLPD
jgi:hypothetical protein